MNNSFVEYLTNMYDTNLIDDVTFEQIDGLVCVYEKGHYIACFTLDYFQKCYKLAFGKFYNFK